MRLIITLTILVALCLFSNVARSATTIRICNSGDTALYVTRVTNAGHWGYGSDNLEIDGWFVVEPNGFSSSCENFDRRGFDGWYYFAFARKGANGVGVITPTLDAPYEGGWITAGWLNSKRKFCVNPKIKGGKMRGNAPAADLQDLSKCPSGWAMAPFSIARQTTGGTYKLTIDPDDWPLVELVTRVIPADATTVAAEKKLDELISGDGFNGRRKYAKHGAVTINGNGLVTVTWIGSTGTTNAKFLVNLLDATKLKVNNEIPFSCMARLSCARTKSKTWICEETYETSIQKGISMEDAAKELNKADTNCRSSDISLQLECRGSDECIAYQRPGYTSKDDKEKIAFTTVDRAEQALLEFNAMIRHFSN